MATAYCLLAAEGPWRLLARRDGATEVVELPVAGRTLDEPGARQLAEVCRAHGWRAGPILLAVPGRWVLVARISTDRLPRSNRRQAMLYRLEEQLPLPAEELVADFAELGGRALGVAVEVRRLSGILSALEAAGLLESVSAICPAAVLAAQGLAARAIPADGSCCLAAEADGRIDLLGIEAGRISSWQNVPARPECLDLALRAERLLNAAGGDAPRPMIAIGLDVPAATTGQAEPMGFAEAVAAGAAGILSGRTSPWVDFRRGALAPTDRLRTIRRPMRAAVVTALVLLATIAGSLRWRAHLQQARAEDLLARQQRVYMDLFDGRRAPQLVRRSLADEAAALGGMRMVSTDVPQRRSALAALRELIARLPGEVRLRVLDLRIEPDGIVVEGQARSHGDAEKIAAGFRTGGVFQVEQPRTERLARGGVAFALTVSPVRGDAKEVLR